MVIVCTSFPVLTNHKLTSIKELYFGPQNRFYLFMGEEVVVYYEL